MSKICPKCQGTLPNCPVCNLPPKRKAPKTNQIEGFNLPFLTTKYWEVQGIDISKWNGSMNFAITKTKCQYVYIRLGYGTQWKDISSDTFYRDARAHDMPIGVYWYCNIGQDPILTATSFAQEIVSHSPQLDIVIDAEESTLSPSATLNWLMTCDTKLTQLTGKKAMIYTSAGFWNPGVARSNYWTGRSLWDANWTTAETPYIPYDWTTWLHWQWSADNNGKAAEYGSTGGDSDMDLNRFQGTCVQFNARYGTHIQPIGGSIVIPPLPGTVPEMVYVNSGEVNLRHAPNPSDPNNICASSKMNQKLYPEAVEKDQYGAEWYKLGKRIYIKKSLTRLP